MATILILYSTTDGQTLRICRRLCQIIESRGHAVTLVAIEEGDPVDVGRYDKVVIGARIRYGKHSPKVRDFIRRNRVALESRPNAFFSVNVVARKPEKGSPESNPYVQKFLRQIAWRPRNLAVFAGKIDYPRYGVIDRTIIRLIMWMTNGPTDPRAVVEFTDWSKVEAFGHLVADMA